MEWRFRRCEECKTASIVAADDDRHWKCPRCPRLNGYSSRESTAAAALADNAGTAIGTSAMRMLDQLAGTETGRPHGLTRGAAEAVTAWARSPGTWADPLDRLLPEPQLETVPGTEQLIPADAVRSPDGTQWWDGHTWRPVADPIPADAVRSPDGSQWWDGSKWVNPQSFAAHIPPPASPPQGSDVSEKMVAVGSLVAAASFVIIAAFLDWYTFVGSDALTVRPQSGIQNGGGIWALVDGALIIVNALALFFATSPRAVKIRLRVLWIVTLATGALATIAIVDISNGNWVATATQAPLTASAGPGVILLGIGAAFLLIDAIALTSRLRAQSWLWGGARSS